MDTLRHLLSFVYDPADDNYKPIRIYGKIPMTQRISSSWHHLQADRSERRSSTAWQARQTSSSARTAI
eukprot:6206591-Pleurochrysis_carterae.AAC.1